MTDKTDKKASPPLMEKIVALASGAGLFSNPLRSRRHQWLLGLRPAWGRVEEEHPRWLVERYGPAARDDVVGIETSIIMHPKVWEASGHVGGFTDPMVDCKTSSQRFRADEIYFLPWLSTAKIVGYVSMLETERTTEECRRRPRAFKRKKAIQGKLEPVQPRDFTQATPEEIRWCPRPHWRTRAALPPRAIST